jgi:TPR repeat protein
VVRAQLEEQANRGDALAAVRLGKAFSLCNGFVRRSDSALTNLMVDALASGMRISDRSSGAPLAPNAVMRIARLSSAQQKRDCADVIGLDEKDAPEQAFKWIERAAALGNLDAQAMYGSLAFAMFDLRTALANADLIRDRKALGTKYLQRSMEQGNALALLESSKHYATGLLFPRDNEAQYAYLYAYSLTSQSEDLLPEIVQLGLDSSSANFDDNTLRRARSQGQQLAECCGAAP